MPRFSVATYNVHQWIGSDGRHDQPRTLKIVQELQADIVALQEVTYPGSESWEAGEARLSEATGMHAVSGPTLLRKNRHFGNVVLTSYPVLRVDRRDLAFSRREPRGALDLDIDIGSGTVVRVIATHLGQREAERRSQVGKLLDLVESTNHSPVIMLGDFNLWYPRSGALARIHKKMGYAAPLRTYPSRYPLLSLDRIWVSPRTSLNSLRVYSTPVARCASDHLPLVATVEL
jgi:endonuclease/exonuclease/phosphatase family metal-dependent hydrolase